MLLFLPVSMSDKCDVNSLAPSANTAHTAVTFMTCLDHGYKLGEHCDWFKHGRHLITCFFFFL